MLEFTRGADEDTAPTEEPTLTPDNTPDAWHTTWNTPAPETIEPAPLPRRTAGQDRTLNRTRTINANDWAQANRQGWEARR